MRVFKGKTAPWYIALFAAVMVGLLGLYIWTVPSAGDDQSMVASLLFILMSVPFILLNDWYTERLRKRELSGGTV